MHRISLFAYLGAAFALLAAPRTAWAQAPATSHAYPAAVQIGARTGVTIHGGNLQDAQSILISGGGVTAKVAKADPGALALEMEVDSPAVPGVRELRVVTPRGVSGPARIWVGPLPAVAETEPNNTTSAAQKLERLPVTLSGQVNGAEDVDVFSFDARAGQSIVLDLVAFGLGSPLDGSLLLTDDRGKPLASGTAPFGRDPRIVHTVKATGTYKILVRDTMYRGGANFVYCLSVGEIPLVTSFLPVAARRGTTNDIQVTGVNLGSTRTLSIHAPQDGARFSAPVRVETGLALHPLDLLLSDLREDWEAEPNNVAAQSNTLVETPAAVSGRIDRRGDVDVFRLTAESAASLVFDLHARRIGSSIDSHLRILDAMGKELAASDDADGKDSRINFNLQAGQTYLIEIRSQEQSFGDRAYYRLTMTPPGAPDFQLFVLPGALNVPKAGSAQVTVNLRRINGFSGGVTLRPEAMPAGISASTAVIPAGQNTALFTLTADGSAGPGQLTQGRIVGSGQVGDRTIERVAVPIEQFAYPQAQENQTAQRELVFLPVAVTPQAAYALATDMREYTVKRGQNVVIKVTAVRQQGNTGQINVTVAGQPGNVNPMLQNIAANASEANITLAVAGNAPTGTFSLVFSGNLGNNIQVAPAILLTITP